MAPSKRNKPAKPPTRAPTRPKPSKKRSHSISTPSIPAPKKARSRAAPPPTRVSPPLRPEVSPFTPSPPASAQPPVDIDAEDNDEGEEEVEDDDTEEPPEPPAVVRFMSVWKAFNGKEVLPGSRSAMLDQDILYLTAIEAWGEKLLRDLLPRKFKVQQLEAIASYENARACDFCQQQINSYEDLWQAVEIIKEWRLRWPLKSLRLDFTLSLVEEKEVIPATPIPTSSQRVGDRLGGRRTATQAQLNDLPELLAAEEDAGNHVPRIADRWSCSNKHCSNYPATCWRNSRSSTSPDHVLHHYPISSENMARWNREILKGESTVDQPSQNIIVQLVNWKEKGRKSNKIEQPKEKDDTFDNLLKALLFKELKSQPQPQPQLPMYPPHYPPYPYPTVDQPQNSSPVRSETDPVELLGFFFKWLADQPGFNNEQQREILKSIKIRLMDEMWNIDTLKASKREGEGMTNEL